MRSGGRASNIRPVPNQPYARPSNSTSLDPLDESNGLSAEPGPFHLSEWEADDTSTPVPGRNRPASDSMDKDTMQAVIHPGGREALIHEHPVQPLHRRQTVSPAMDKPLTVPLSDPVNENAESVHNHYTKGMAGQMELARGERQRPLPLSSARDDSRLRPLQSQPKSAEFSLPLTLPGRMDDARATALAANKLFAEQNGRSSYGDQAPEIHVSIGRVEIRATMSSPPERKASAKPPTMSLDEYLKKRGEGTR